MRHHPYATAYTRTGKVNMLNRKPYRTAAQKAEARRTAELVNGTHVSSAPVSYHRAPKSKVAA
ncbi:hypothetical protein J5277_09650 [Rhizobium sp. 16-449-1b]|uniref:hypothetical protein n=1 Tax=Rhizobium sp. 16-449-1b TaxID=2819989 RepID=UPI001ADD38CE|nr:hypothetical protein [Rhizobium sp. 16-449-1b]MBO9194369.1 hypothetical protein [Rhizobium sp. 16-449-1b]